MSNQIHNVYLDHAATTYLDPRVKKAMDLYWEDNFGNPSSLYSAGRRAKKALEEARITLAHVLHCQQNEIIFTSGGTESDNLAILGVAKANDALGRPKKHIVTSRFEHRAVLSACMFLETQGYAVTYLDVTQDGFVDPTALDAALRGDTLLVSIMYANNEVGTIQQVKELASLCHAKGVLFHTDACQAAGALSLDLQELGVDLLTLNGSKIYGPKGVGLLYIKQGTKIQPLLYGGGQEKGLRSGTENVPAAIGLAKALELANYEKNPENKRLIELRDYFAEELMKKIPNLYLNGDLKKRLPNNVNVRIDGIDGESFILLMDEAGIACASGSACDSQTQEPSHALLAIGLTPEQAQSSIRFTLGKRTTKKDLDYVITCTVESVNKLRKQ
jgi:cysteine desulfurase